jgi:hypothetical protein
MEEQLPSKLLQGLRHALRIHKYEDAVERINAIIALFPEEDVFKEIIIIKDELNKKISSGIYPTERVEEFKKVVERITEFEEPSAKEVNEPEIA